MLHLFDKVYLEFDEKIDINYDRVVISDQYGIKMSEQLDKIAYGQLLAYGKTYDEALAGSDIVQLIKIIKVHADKSGRKVMVYCDIEAYKVFVSQWFKIVLPNLDLESFTTLLNYVIYNERAVSNTQLSSNYSIKLQCIWNDLSDITDSWNRQLALSNSRLELFKSLNLNLSYEFLIADYLSGSTNRKEQLKTTMHKFIRRWFKELFNDNRQMVLLNVGNHAFQRALGFYPTDIDITSVDPLSGIEQLEAYADNEIWEMDENFVTGAYGICNLENLSEEKVNALISTVLNVYSSYEGMQTDVSSFDVLDWAHIAARSEITDEELDEVLARIVEAPFDTNLVPRFDFQNVNFPLFMWFLRQKYENKDLTKFRLL
jgi:hypothetical protein